MLGSIGAWLSVSGIDHSGSIGVALRVATGVMSLVAGGLDGGEVSTGGNEQVKEQLVPSRRDKARIRKTIKALVFILFIADSVF